MKTKTHCDVPGQLFFDDSVLYPPPPAPKPPPLHLQAEILAALDAGKSSRSDVLEFVYQKTQFPKSFIRYTFDGMVADRVILRSGRNYDRPEPEFLPEVDNSQRDQGAMRLMRQMIRENHTSVQIEQALVDEFDFDSIDEIRVLWAKVDAVRAAEVAPGGVHERWWLQ